MQRNEEKNVPSHKDVPHNDQTNYRPPRLTLLQLMTILALSGILLTWILRSFFH